MPYDGFLRFLEVGLLAFTVALLLGLGLGCHVKVLGDKVRYDGFVGLRVWKTKKEGKE